MSTFFLNQATSQRYFAGIPFTYGEMNYTAAGATEQTFHELGFVRVDVQPRPDDRYYINNSNPKDDGSWDSQPRDLKDLITQHIAQVKQAAASVLQPTDWKIIREMEAGTPAGADLKAWRKAVRDESDVKVAAIEAATTVDELIAVVSAADFLSWPDAEFKPVEKRASSTRK